MKTIRLYDTHCHPQMGAYDSDRDEIIRRALDVGIGLIVIGTNVADSLAGVKLAEGYVSEPVFATVGVHPTEEDGGELAPETLPALLGSQKIVGIGECGLDYYHVEDQDARDLQADVFEQQILLALEQKLPLVIHCRDRNGSIEAYQDCATILRRHGVKNFVMHCFGGGWREAESFLELGGMISVTGILTFPKSDALKEVVKRAPISRLMVETDAPFLSPQPYRGRRNEPAWVERVAQEVATIRGVGQEQIARQTTLNAEKFFGLHRKRSAAE